MLNLISCELLKLKRSKMVLISVAGVLSTPLLMLIEALQTHFDKPEIIFTLSDIYSDSVLYIMLLVNIMIYVAIAAYLFSRECTSQQKLDTNFKYYLSINLISVQYGASFATFLSG